MNDDSDYTNIDMKIMRHCSTCNAPIESLIFTKLKYSEHITEENHMAGYIVSQFLIGVCTCVLCHTYNLVLVASYGKEDQDIDMLCIVRPGELVGMLEDETSNCRKVLCHRFGEGVVNKYIGDIYQILSSVSELSMWYYLSTIGGVIDYRYRISPRLPINSNIQLGWSAMNYIAVEGCNSEHMDIYMAASLVFNAHMAKSYSLLGAATLQRNLHNNTTSS